MESTYNLAKFEDGLTYFIKTSEESGESSIRALLNVKELKEHAQYHLTLIETKDSSKKEHVIHGVFLTPKNLLNISLALLENNPSLMSDLEKIT